MYRILTKLHTEEKGVYRFYMVYNENNELVEYGTDNPEEAIRTALELLRKVGYRDLKVVDDRRYYVDIDNLVEYGITEEDIERATKLLGNVGYDDLFLNHEADYGLDWHWGNRPDEKPEEYTMTFSSDKAELQYKIIRHIKAEDVVTNDIVIPEDAKSFHLIINGIECLTGLPPWIKYTSLDKTHGTLVFTGVNQNYVIEVVVDYSALTPVEEEALEDMIVVLTNDLSIDWDQEVLDLDFYIEDGDLIVDNNLNGVDFNINDKNLEVMY